MAGYTGRVRSRLLGGAAILSLCCIGGAVIAQNSPQTEPAPPPAPTPSTPAPEPGVPAAPGATPPPAGEAAPPAEATHRARVRCRKFPWPVSAPSRARRRAARRGQLPPGRTPGAKYRARYRPSQRLVGQRHPTETGAPNAAAGPPAAATGEPDDGLRRGRQRASDHAPWRGRRGGARLDGDRAFRRRQGQPVLPARLEPRSRHRPRHISWTTCRSICRPMCTARATPTSTGSFRKPSAAWISAKVRISPTWETSRTPATCTSICATASTKHRAGHRRQLRLL